MLGRELKGRYKIIKNLGRGGFGKTYVAEDTHRPGAPYCVVKQLNLIFKDREFLQIARRLFSLEAEILEKLGRHAQIPQLLAYFEEDKEFYLVEEFIKGHCLKNELIVGKRFPDFTVVNLLKDILGILAFIHKQGVIHRDIKPGNIIKREQDGRAVLIDFGAVKQIQPHVLKEQGSITLTTLTIAIGTADYAPLEQLAGQPSFNSDIYALGIVSIQALTGIPPNQLKRDPQTGAVVWRHQAQVREELAEIIDKMTHYMYTERYQSATAVLEDLDKLDYANAVTPTIIDPTTTSSLPAKTTSSNLVLSSEEYSKLEELLREFVGTIGPFLLQQALTQALTVKELVESLSVYLTQHQRTKFESQAMAFLQKPAVSKEITSQTPTTVLTSHTSKSQAVNDSFLSRCEQELINLIGPIGRFLVQKAMKSNPQISSQEIVEILAAQIPNPQKAAEFRCRLLS
jgi:serine/threonine-protein kinase